MPPLRMKTTEPNFLPLSYSCKGSPTIITFSPEVLAHFHANRHIGKSRNEVGGQLFAKIDTNHVRVLKATGPNVSDKRGWAWFAPDQKRQNLEIKQLFSLGLHFIGDWHTHPENDPSPSSVDLKSMTECFKQSRHQLRAFLMVIVGRRAFPDGLWASLHGHAGYEQLALISSSTEADSIPIASSLVPNDQTKKIN